MFEDAVFEGRTGGWIQTSSGQPFWPLSPRPEDFSIFDIAHALSNLCRYGGHASQFYSVAEHSVLVSEIVPPEYALDALMHDATEAYCVDVPRPLKLQLANYAEIESGIWRALADRYALSPELPACVHEADNAVLLAEKEVLLGPSPRSWGIPGTPAKVTIRGYPPEVARDMFLSRYAALLYLQQLNRRAQSRAFV